VSDYAVFMDLLAKIVFGAHEASKHNFTARGKLDKNPETSVYDFSRAVSAIKCAGI
jgi:hypothetical protein